MSRQAASWKHSESPSGHAHFCDALGIVLDKMITVP